MNRVHSALVVMAGILGLAAAGVDLRSEAGAARLASAIAAEGDYISAPDLGERIARGDTLRVLDLRSLGEYEQLHIASASHATIEDLARASFPPDATLVLYSDGGAAAAQAWMLLRSLGHRHVVVLREGVYEWIGRVLEPRLARDASTAERAEFARTAELSRFFGGVPLADVPRADVPIGYWTGLHQSHRQPAGATKRAIASIRRRGC